MEFWQIAQRLKFYRKRHAKYYQKIRYLERMNKPISTRLIEAENNNRAWAQFYDELIKRVPENVNEQAVELSTLCE